MMPLGTLRPVAEGRVARAALAVAATGLLSACAGLMQRSLPDAVRTYAAFAAGEGLKVGAAERDITPEGSVYLAGFGLD